MKKKHTLTKISLGIDIAAIFVIFVYFVAIVPNWSATSSYGGFLILSPPLFGLFGLITAIIGLKKNKTVLGIMLIILNIIFLCWWPVIWVGGTLLLGP